MEEGAPKRAILARVGQAWIVMAMRKAASFFGEKPAPSPRPLRRVRVEAMPKVGKYTVDVAAFEVFDVGFERGCICKYGNSTETYGKIWDEYWICIIQIFGCVLTGCVIVANWKLFAVFFGQMK